MRNYLTNTIYYRTYNTEWVGQNPIYFNPTADSGTCTEQDYNNNTNKLGKTGCMKWYAYSENSDGTINMILNHNTTSGLAWVSSSDYNKAYNATNGAKSLGITYPSNTVQGTDSYGSDGNWNKGPITLLKQLLDDTNPSGNTANRWKNSLIQRSSYESYTNSNKYYKTESETTHDNYTINYSGYNARLITAQEVAYIVNSDWDEKISTSYVIFSSTTYAWLLENLYTSSNTSLPDGYWTVSSYANNSDYAWAVNSNRYIGNVNVFLSSERGIRPVIAVSNSVVFGS